MQVRFEIFPSALESWESVCRRAAAFATTVGPDRLITICQSETNRFHGSVIVWYWDDAPSPA